MPLCYETPPPLTKNTDPKKDNSCYRLISDCYPSCGEYLKPEKKRKKNRIKTQTKLNPICRIINRFIFNFLCLCIFLRNTCSIDVHVVIFVFICFTYITRICLNDPKFHIAVILPNCPSNFRYLRHVKISYDRDNM